MLKIFKIFERIILQKMTNFIANKILNHRYQSRYRKQHSALTILLKIRNYIKKATKGGNTIISTFGDYCKAFDSF